MAGLGRIVVTLMHNWQGVIQLRDKWAQTACYFKSTIRTSWVVEEKVTLLLLNLENINSYVAQGTLKNISVTYSITVMLTPSF